ncbi:SDR family NAD(P)-dependent oxidoreductase [Scatolibacter rhodanostii]|uniref:SDR family NAD(P)-dependent oxidoreductase n=1 Tax=Scatolibacter rhodanostii TaxID=2014781 RepID=UPI000C07FB26|nr:SDR family NAD(P)-dependent oxidoreductase [Scatolibacter rhodanostii]
MAVAIITGASSGLGREYVNAVVEQYPLIDEFWLISRHKENLKELADEHQNKTIAAISLDLAESTSFEIFEKLLRENEPEIKVLINCAGFGQVVSFFSADKKRQTDMIDLNCRALTHMTRLCLPYMIDDSLVINVSSIASFAPLPRMSVYSATKSYVLAFSKALREELRPRGINVLAACPGVMETNFYDIAYAPEGPSKFLDSLPKILPAEFAESSLRAGRYKKAFYTKGAFYKMYHLIAKIVPHNWLIRFFEL